MVDTTIPRDGTADVGNQVPSWAFVLLWSFEEPHRVGEVAFLAPFEASLIGRGDEEVDKFAHFGQHGPGEPLPRPLREGFLAGSGISRRQLIVRATAVAVEMDQVGRATTFVNARLPWQYTLGIDVLTEQRRDERLDFRGVHGMPPAFIVIIEGISAFVHGLIANEKRSMRIMQ